MIGADVVNFIQFAQSAAATASNANIDEKALQTYGGASSAVWVLYTTYRALFKRDSLPIAFILSIMVSLIVTFGLNGRKPTELIAWFVALLNGCLLFCAASGVQEVLRGAAQPQRGEPRANRAIIPGFWDPWFPNSAPDTSRH